MGLDNFDFMCYPKISFRYRKHSHLPHAHILVLVRMGPTNQETLLWLQSLTGPKYSSSTLEQAKTFFGSFDGDRKGFNLWKENFSKEHKKLKQGIHTQLMKACGGTGSHFDIPPTDFLPHSMTVGDKCAHCNESFENDTMLKEHIKNNHKDHLKREFSREALEFVLRDPKYVDWLNKTTSGKHL